MENAKTSLCPTICSISPFYPLHPASGGGYGKRFLGEYRVGGLRVIERVDHELSRLSNIKPFHLLS